MCVCVCAFLESYSRVQVIIIHILACLQTPESFHNEYSRRAIAGRFDVVDAGVRLYDVMWVLAQALNNTVAMVERGDINESDCADVSGELVPLEQFNYTNEKMGCLLQWNLQQTNFLGGSVSVVYIMLNSCCQISLLEQCYVTGTYHI